MLPFRIVILSVRIVILSAAKNPSTTLRTGLTVRPFAGFILSIAEGLRVTDLVCQSLVDRFRLTIEAGFLPYSSSRGGAHQVACLHCERSSLSVGGLAKDS